MFLQPRRFPHSYGSAPTGWVFPVPRQAKQASRPMFHVIYRSQAEIQFECEVNNNDNTCHVTRQDNDKEKSSFCLQAKTTKMTEDCFYYDNDNNNRPSKEWHKFVTNFVIFGWKENNNKISLSCQTLIRNIEAADMDHLPILELDSF